MVQSCLIHLGDLRVSAALAAGVMVWLATARCYRAACLWCGAYCSAIGIVAASKIMYLGWGLQINAVDFSAASGHAVGSAVVLPVVLYILAKSISSDKANLAFGAGLAIATSLAFCLVVNGEHTLAEAFAGWCIGIAASTVCWRSMRHTTIQPMPMGVVVAVGITVVVANGMQLMPVNHLLAKTASVLSGKSQTHIWRCC